MLHAAQNAFFTRVADLACEEKDSQEVRLRKSLLLGACFVYIPIVIPYILIYAAAGEPLAALVSLLYFVLSWISVLVFLRTRRFNLLLRSQQLLVLFAPFLFLVALGGWANASAVIVWSVICPLGTLVIAEPRSARRWLVAYLGLVVLSGFLPPALRGASNLPAWLVDLFFTLNIGAVSSMVFILLYYFVQEKDKAYHLLNLEQEKSERLLLNVLPREIAPILKNEDRTIADQYDSASILFADVVGFTPLSSEMAPAEMVDLLNEIFSHFDALVDKYSLEKIRTVGDNYMVAAGAPSPRLDHAQAIASMALDMLAYLKARPAGNGPQISFRIGINSGPLIAGVIGRTKFHYDVWGDTVNIASRMESHGEAGKIQIGRATYELLKDEFVCEPRGTIYVKGKGEMETWFLIGKKV